MLLVKVRAHISWPHASVKPNVLPAQHEHMYLVKPPQVDGQLADTPECEWLVRVGVCERMFGEWVTKAIEVASRCK